MEEAGMSRLYGGIHFADGNNAGKDIGKKTGAQAFAKARRYWEGTAWSGEHWIRMSKTNPVLAGFVFGTCFSIIR